MTIYSFFADILDYPEHSIAKSIGDCAAELAVQAPEAHVQIMEFLHCESLKKTSANSRRFTPTPSTCAPTARRISDITYSAMMAGAVFFWWS